MYSSCRSKSILDLFFSECSLTVDSAGQTPTSWVIPHSLTHQAEVHMKAQSKIFLRSEAKYDIY